MIAESVPLPTERELRQFAWTVSAALVVMFGLVLPWLFDRPWPLWPWPVAAVLAGWGAIAPRSLAGVYRAWMKIGHVLGWINTRILLGLVFFALVTPLALLMRVLGKRPLDLRFEAERKSYRIPSKARERQTMERPF